MDDGKWVWDFVSAGGTGYPSDAQECRLPYPGYHLLFLLTGRFYARPYLNLQLPKCVGVVEENVSRSWIWMFRFQPVHILHESLWWGRGFGLCDLLWRCE